MSSSASFKYLGFIVALLSFSSPACYPRISPTGPAVKDAASFLMDAPSVSPNYEALDRRTELPVIPFRLWGVDFAEEMLFELKGHPLYAMVEICHVRKRGGEWTWFVLVAEHDGRQHVGVAGEADYKLGQSFPAPVYRSGLQVERREAEGRISYAFSLLLPNGEDLAGTVHARASGATPRASQRNGSAMNHSHETALAIIDLEEFSWARPSVTLSGVHAPVRSLAPGLPYAMRLEQVAGGISSGQLSLAQDATGEALELGSEPIGERDPSKITTLIEGDEVLLASADEVVDVDYRFHAPKGLEGPMELHRATVTHGEVQAFDIRFSPPLPDLRYTLLTEQRGRVVAGVHGREGYMVGTYLVSAGEESHLDIVPSAPFWACERPTRSDFEVRVDRVITRTEIRPDLAVNGAGAEKCFELR